MLTRADLFHVLDALESAETELEELINEKEWYVTSVTDVITSAKRIITEELKNFEPRRKPAEHPRDSGISE